MPDLLAPLEVDHIFTDVVMRDRRIRPGARTARRADGLQRSGPGAHPAGPDVGLRPPPMQDPDYRRLFSFPRMVEDLPRGFLPGSWLAEVDFSTLRTASRARLGNAATGSRVAEPPAWISPSSAPSPAGRMRSAVSPPPSRPVRPEPAVSITRRVLGLGDPLPVASRSVPPLLRGARATGDALRSRRPCTCRRNRRGSTVI